jgi:hypothetical protein
MLCLPHEAMQGEDAERAGACPAPDHASVRVVVLGDIGLVGRDRLAELRAGLVAALPVVLGAAEGFAGGLAAGRADRRDAHAAKVECSRAQIAGWVAEQSARDQAPGPSL